MRVVVSVKATPGGGQTTQAARYIAYRERDEEREGTEPRPLFSARENALSFWKAERVLTAGRAPQKNEVIHIAVSFREGDFEALGRSEKLRQESLREVTREAVTQVAEVLRADQLRWVAGIHRNTDHPHIHLLIHREYLDRDTRAEQRLRQIPEEMLATRIQNEHEGEKVHPGSFSQAFETALDRAQERARQEPQEREHTAAEKIVSIEEQLLAAARRNPSIAGRELVQEIILREPIERPAAIDLREAFRTPSLDDPAYRSAPEQADWLGRQSQELRDLYERGAQVRGDVLILPAEAHELSGDGDRPFLSSLAYAHQQIRNPAQAAEFHTLARTIAGEHADSRTDVEIFKHYYAEIRAGRLEQTLETMRQLADEMARLETRASIEIARPVFSFEERRETGRLKEEDGYDGDTGDYLRDFSDAFARELDDAAEVSEREEERPGGALNTAARKIRLDEESLRFPEDLSDERKLALVARTLPAIDRQIESGQPVRELLSAIDESVSRPELSEKEREERFRIGIFLKDYVAERLRDPETKALNSSDRFRRAHGQFTEARTPERLNEIAAEILRENRARGEALPEKPGEKPLTPRERTLLFFGRPTAHHTTEMRELRFAWGLSRTERAARVEALAEERLAPSPSLKEMLAELDTRHSLPALRHYQASILNEEMRNPGKLDLRQLYQRLPPHERTYLIERIEEKKDGIERVQRPDLASQTEIRIDPVGRSVGEAPRESPAYREYLAQMGAAESRLLQQALGQRLKGDGRGPESFSIDEARSLLPREERIHIREQARQLAWDQFTQAAMAGQYPSHASQALSETINKLREEAQPRARLAQTVLREKNGLEAKEDMRYLQALEAHAVRTREELYRGFETLDSLRRELARERFSESIERDSSDRFPSDFSRNSPPEIDDSRFPNGAPLPPNGNSTVAPWWFVDSQERWHFDRLRDQIPPMPANDPGAEHEHDYSHDR